MNAVRKPLKRVVESKPDLTTLVPLYTKYRPDSLDMVVGQEAVVSSLRNTLQNKSTMPHSFLLHGPSGTGKTTLARILAKELSIRTVVETDAATQNGIDDIKALIESVQFKSFDGGKKLVILDECHALSKQAWQALLKTVEEPPAHVFFVFCTTDFSKVPETIKTRCQVYGLKGVPDTALEALVEVIAEQEGITCDPDVLEVLIRTSCGSPRDALSKLSLLRGCSREEAFALLEEPEARQEIITLARELAAGREISWANLCNLLKQCNESAESIRLMLVNYLGSVLLNTKREEEACRLLSILEHFSTPFAANEKMAPLLLAFGKCLFATE